jgi:secreted trypsin-like serine protease
MARHSTFSSIVRGSFHRARSSNNSNSGSSSSSSAGRVSCIACCMMGALALVACSSSGGDAGSQRDADGLALGHFDQPILRGELDREQHPQVMLLANLAGFLCTGTVVHVEGRSGYLLTAAHCVTEEADGGGVVPIAADQFVVVPGADFAESTTAFSVDAVSVEPGYDGSFAKDDVAVVRFVFGATRAPAAIPPLAASEDELDVDSELLLVGFGQTDTDDGNTQRRRVERRVEDLDDELVAYTQEDGKGACFGDSGGPGLVKVGSAERVAVVISGGVDSDERCAGGFGVATRVSAYEDFIAAALAGGASD